jgi:hypothetical protein
MDDDILSADLGAITENVEKTQIFTILAYIERAKRDNFLEALLLLILRIILHVCASVYSLRYGGLALAYGSVRLPFHFNGTGNPSELRDLL